VKINEMVDKIGDVNIGIPSFSEVDLYFYGAMVAFVLIGAFIRMQTKGGE